MNAYIEPLKGQLTELDSAILEQQDRISIVKCSTLKNATRIHTLLSAVSVPGNWGTFSCCCPPSACQATGEPSLAAVCRQRARQLRNLPSLLSAVSVPGNWGIFPRYCLPSACRATEEPSLATVSRQRAGQLRNLPSLLSAVIVPGNWDPEDTSPLCSGCMDMPGEVPILGVRHIGGLYLLKSKCLI